MLLGVSGVVGISGMLGITGMLTKSGVSEQISSVMMGMLGMWRMSVQTHRSNWP